MRFLAVLPILTALAAVCCVLLPAARRFVWPVVALAAVNVVATPLTSGEWFYQRTEDAAYEQAVARGDFDAFDRLLAGHDPHLQPRMMAMAVGLLVALAAFGVVRVRARRGEHEPAALRWLTTVAVLLAALAMVVHAGLRLA